MTTAVLPEPVDVKARPLTPLSFFVLTFVLSWLVWIPLDLAHFEIGPLRIAESTSNVVRLLGVLMPAVAAIILTANTGGRNALRGLFSRLVLWRVGWQWWLAAVLAQPVLLALTGVVVNLLSEGSPVSIPPAMPLSAWIVNVFFLLLATLGEEIGWRGVALPTLQKSQRPLKASAVLGLLWAVWHIPFWLLLDTFSRFGFGYIALNFLLVFPLTFYITWIFNRSRSSILLPVASHLAFNIVNTVLFPVTIHVGAFAVLVGLEWVVMCFIVTRLRTGALAVRPGAVGE